MNTSLMRAKTTKLVAALTGMAMASLFAGGCTTGYDEEETTTPIGESLHVVPEVYEGAAEQMTCRDVGLELDNWRAHGWVDCTLDVAALTEGEHSFEELADFSGSAECSELLALSLEVYDTEEGRKFDWTSLNEELISAVLVKDGPRANLYTYGIAIGADAGLHAPDAEGIWGDIDHVSFCVERGLDIRHAAYQDVSPQYDWQVELTADPSVLELEDEETGEVDYRIVVSATEDGEFERLIRGTAFITNNTDLDAEIDAVIPNVGEATGEVDCGVSFPYTLEARTGIECNYAVVVDADIGFSATAAVTVVTTEESPVRGVYTEWPLTLDFPDPQDFEQLNVSPVGESCPFEEQPCEYFFTESYTCPFDEGTQRTVAGNFFQGITGEVEVEVVCAPPLRQGTMTVHLFAEPGFMGPYVWDLDVSADPDVLELGGFESGSTTLEIVASAEDIGESFYYAQGEVYLGNGTDYDGEIASVLVEIDGVTVEADCGMEPPFVFPARSSLECPFFARDIDPNASGAEVTVVVTPESDLYGGSADYDFHFVGSTEPLETVTIDSGQLEESCHYTETCVFEREVHFQCPEDGGRTRLTAMIRQTQQLAETYVDVLCDAEFEGALRVRTVPIARYYYFYDWSIEKQADRNTLHLNKGETGTVNYWVDVIASETHVDHFVEGQMFITNETDFDAEIASAEVLIDGEFVALLDCGVTFPYVVEAHHGIECTYDAQNLTGTESYIEVNVSVTEQSQLMGQRFEMDFIFGGLPHEELFDSITVRDELNGKGVFEETCPTPSACTFEYEKSFSCPADEGLQVNEAEIVETGASDTANLEVFCDLTKH